MVAAIALGFSTDKMIRTCAQTWTKDITKKIDISSVLKILRPKLYGFDDLLGVYDDSVMSDNLSTAFGEETKFSDTSIQIYCVATDFHTGESEVLSEGLLAKALRISSGIPIIIRPIEWGGKLLIDGALSNPLPLDVAIQEGADIIFASGFETPMQPSVDSVNHFASRMFSILVNQLWSTLFSYYNLAYHPEIVAIIPEFKEPIRVNAVDQVPFIIEQGEKEARKHIMGVDRLLDTPPES